MYSPRGSTGSDRSSCSSGFSSGGGPSHLKDWPLGRSATHERYIKPVPPMYVTEYEASYTWPKTVQKQNGSEAQPKPSKMTPWRELEETVEELEHLEQRYPTIFQQELKASAGSTKQQVHDHLLAENIEKAYKHYKAKLAKLDHSKRQEDGYEESKRDVGDEEETKDGDGGATGLRGVSGGGGRGTGTTQPRPSPRPQSLAHMQKEKAKSVQKSGTGHSEHKDGTGGRVPVSHHDQRIMDAFREKMVKFCESVEALKRGEIEGSPVK